MARIVMHLNNHGSPYPVQEMRRRLAELLSKLDGSQGVVFDFQAVLDNYQIIDMPPEGPVYGALARQEND